MITISLSPNTAFCDVMRSMHMFLTPWFWKKGTYEGRVSAWFSDHTHGYTFFVTSGRSALSLFLDAAGIGPGDEVIIQAFTCVVVVNSISFVGATPVFADVDETLNIDPKEIEKHITSKTKAIIIQHTFGTPAQIEAVIRIARNHHLLVIEDCAHGLGAVYKGRNIGTFGDAAVWSFGRDKVISSVFGGAVTVTSPRYRDTLQTTIQSLPYPKNRWIAQQLFHPIAFHFLILPWYRCGVGKAVLVVLQRLHLLSFPVTQEERHGEKPSQYSIRYPNALAYLVIGQLERLPRFKKGRNAIAAYYDEALKHMDIQIIPRTEQGAALRYGILVKKPDVIRNAAKKQGILLGNWYHEVIDPGGDGDKKRYRKGSCPHAEYAASHILNLPTTISHGQAADVVSFLRKTI